MSSDNQGVIHSASEGGVIGEHPASPQSQFLVGPATGTEVNTIRVPPIPILCWKVEDTRFEFDSSFVTFDVDSLTNPSDATSDPIALPTPSTQSDIRSELKVLASQINLNPGCPLSVFGHADPVGPAMDPDGYNKALSGRRATSIYALLISGTQLQTAVGLWQNIANQENWAGNSLGQVQKMQTVTGLSAGTSMGDLISSYLPKLLPPEFAALNIGPANFLAQGADPGGKGDYQGCSSFNPLIIFSQKKEDGFAAGAYDQNQQVYDARNLANAPNRRVMVLIFAKGSKVDPAKWPCPNAGGAYPGGASADKSGCIKRFWSDGDSRRSTRLPDKDRRFDDTQDTFACRFYQRLTCLSPCENQRTFSFYYGLQMTLNLPWSQAAKLTVVSEDGNQTQTFAMSEGIRSADLLYFIFRFIRPGIRYRATVTDEKVVIKLFPYTDLSRIADPDDPASVIPPLPSSEINPEISPEESQ